MNRIIFSTLIAVMLLSSPQFASAEQRIYLVDGSVLQGSVLSLDGERIVVATSYSDSLVLPRGQVLAILLQPDKGNPLALEPTSAPAASTGAESQVEQSLAEPTPEGTGFLELAIKGDAIKSSVRFRHKNEKPRMLELNTIYLRIYLDGKQVYEKSDSSMEKDFHDRQWIFLRNHHQFKPVTLDVPAGTYQAHIVVGNKLDLLEEGENQSQLVSAETVIEELQINPDETTRVVLDGDGSRFGYGKYKLKILSRR